MSHFTRVGTECRDERHLIAALETLGYEVREDALVPGWRGQTVHADIVAMLPNGYGVGFRRVGDDGPFEALSDWGMNGTSRESFLASVHLEYTKRVVLEEARSEGYHDARLVRGADGSWIVEGTRPCRRPGPGVKAREQVSVRIARDGSEVEIETKGFQGSACKASTEKLERSLGAEKDFRKKPEYYQTSGANSFRGTSR